MADESRGRGVAGGSPQQRLSDDLRAWVGVSDSEPDYPSPWVRVLILAFSTSAVAMCVVGLLVFLGGCTSSTQQIANNANEASALAHDSRAKIAELLAILLPFADVLGQVVFTLLAGIDANQVGIIERAAGVTAAVADVTDKVWAGWGVIRWAATALAVVGVAFLLWYTGAGFVIKRVCLWLGWFIPKPVHDDVDLDRDLMAAADEGDPTRLMAAAHAAVAARRARDKRYDKAWGMERRKDRQLAASVRGVPIGRAPHQPPAVGPSVSSTRQTTERVEVTP